MLSWPGSRRSKEGDKRSRTGSGIRCPAAHGVHGGLFCSTRVMTRELTSTSPATWCVHGVPSRPGCTVSGDGLSPAEVPTTVDAEWGQVGTPGAPSRSSDGGVPAPQATVVTPVVLPAQGHVSTESRVSTPQSLASSCGPQLWPRSGFAVQGAGGGWAPSPTPRDSSKTISSLLIMAGKCPPKGANLGRCARRVWGAGGVAAQRPAL